VGASGAGWCSLARGLLLVRFEYVAGDGCAEEGRSQGGSEGWGDYVMFDDDAASGFFPAAVFVEHGGGTHGAEYGVGGRPGVSGLFDDAVEGVLEPAAAAGEEAGGQGVAVEGDF